MNGPRRLQHDPWILIGKKPSDLGVPTPPHGEAVDDSHRRRGVRDERCTRRRIDGSCESHHDRMAEVRVDMVALDIAFRHADKRLHHRNGTGAQLPERDGRRSPHLEVVVGEPVDQRGTRRLPARGCSTVSSIHSAGPCLAQVSRRHRADLPGRIGDRRSDHRQRLLCCRAIAVPAGHPTGDLAKSCEGMHTGQQRL